MVLHDGLRQIESGRFGRHDTQLQAKAFGGRARADAGRFELLQVMQRNLQFVRIHLHVLRDHFGDFFQRLGQVAVIVKILDKQGDQAAIAPGQVEQQQLFEHMLAQ